MWLCTLTLADESQPEVLRAHRWDVLAKRCSAAEEEQNKIKKTQNKGTDWLSSSFFFFARSALSKLTHKCVFWRNFVCMYISRDHHCQIDVVKTIAVIEVLWLSRPVSRQHFGRLGLVSTWNWPDSIFRREQHWFAILQRRECDNKEKKRGLLGKTTNSFNSCVTNPLTQWI